MKIVDSHCHLNRLDLAPYGGTIAGVLAHAASLEVHHYLCVAVDLADHAEICAIAKAHEAVDMSVGVHPNEDLEEPLAVDTLVALAQAPKVVAIGETGLDYYRSTGDLTWQQERFRTHIRAAQSVNKPLIIHTREADVDTVRIIKEENAERVSGVMHCFTGDWAMAEQCLALGFRISFSGIVTFKNAETLREVAKRVPEDRLLVETDAPYLAPEPHRGAKNVPGYTRYVLDYLAQLRGVTPAALAVKTTENYERLFQRGVIK